MSDMMRVDEQPTWDGMTTKQMQVEIERLRNERDEALSNFGTSRRAHEASLTDLNAEIERLTAALREAYEWIQPQSYCTASMEWEERARVAKAIRAALEEKP